MAEEAKDINIFDMDDSVKPSQNRSLRSMAMQDDALPANFSQRPNMAGEIMQGAFMPLEDCFDLFIDFIESDEWLLPIESFIDYFCLVFPTQDYNEHKSEKMKVFNEYQSIVRLNLDSFLYKILYYSKEQLSNLLAQYESELTFEDMMYFLAVEDYFIFHDFMYEANVAKNQGRFGIGFSRQR